MTSIAGADAPKNNDEQALPHAGSQTQRQEPIPGGLGSATQRDLTAHLITPQSDQALCNIYKPARASMSTILTRFDYPKKLKRLSNAMKKTEFIWLRKQALTPEHGTPDDMEIYFSAPPIEGRHYVADLTADGDGERACWLLGVRQGAVHRHVAKVETSVMGREVALQVCSELATLHNSWELSIDMISKPGPGSRHPLFLQETLLRQATKRLGHPPALGWPTFEADRQLLSGGVYLVDPSTQEEYYLAMKCPPLQYDCAPHLFTDFYDAALDADDVELIPFSQSSLPNDMGIEEPKRLEYERAERVVRAVMVIMSARTMTKAAARAMRDFYLGQYGKESTYSGKALVNIEVKHSEGYISITPRRLLTGDVTTPLPPLLFRSLKRSRLIPILDEITNFWLHDSTDLKTCWVAGAEGLMRAQSRLEDGARSRCMCTCVDDDIKDKLICHHCISCRKQYICFNMDYSEHGFRICGPCKDREMERYMRDDDDDAEDDEDDDQDGDGGPPAGGSKLSSLATKDPTTAGDNERRTTSSHSKSKADATRDDSHVGERSLTSVATPIRPRKKRISKPVADSDDEVPQASKKARSEVAAQAEQQPAEGVKEEPRDDDDKPVSSNEAVNDHANVAAFRQSVIDEIRMWGLQVDMLALEADFAIMNAQGDLSAWVHARRNIRGVLLVGRRLQLRTTLDHLLQDVEQNFPRRVNDAAVLSLIGRMTDSSADGDRVGFNALQVELDALLKEEADEQA